MLICANFLLVFMEITVYYMDGNWAVFGCLHHLKIKSKRSILLPVPSHASYKRL